MKEKAIKEKIENWEIQTFGTSCNRRGALWLFLIMGIIILVIDVLKK